MRRRVVAGSVLVALVALVAVVALVAGCGAGTGALPPDQTARSKAALCVPSGGSTGAGPSQSTQPLPDLTLPCFGAGQDVRITRLGAPAVINLWASWCGPCRVELPAFQRYAERVGERLRVVGVNTEDTRPAAQSLVDDLHLTFPMLYDRQGSLRKALGTGGLPVTVFVNSRGEIAYLYNSQAMDEATIELLAERHLGVVVPGA